MRHKLEEEKVMKEIQGTVKSVIKDQIVQILLKNSSFTEIQLETLLLDFHSRQSLGKVKLEKLADVRNVARGSFSRVLHQGKKNYIRAVYTILLLNYLGYFEQDPFTIFLKLNEEILGYAAEYDALFTEQDQLPAEKKEMKLKKLHEMQARLKSKIEELAQPMFSLK